MMEVIENPKSINSFIEPSTFSDRICYKLSVFVHVRKIDNIILLFNTLTGALLCISYQDWIMLDINCAKRYDDVKIVRDLVSLHCLVPKELDETERYRELYDLVLAFDSQKGIRRYNILSTTSCNLRCYYCFENGIKFVNMTQNTANKLIDYIVNSHDNTRPVHLRWFGGEPLVNSHAIDVVCRGLNERNVDFFSTMSSNGVLFTSDVIKRIPDWRLKKVRLSLDGYGKEHDIRKGLNTNGRIFESVIQNISNLINENVEVVIRLTIDSNNIEQMEELSLWLIDKFHNNPNISIYNRCVFQEVSSEVYSKKPESVRLLVSRVESLDNLLISNNIYDMSRIAPIGFNSYYCAASDPHAVVVTPDGLLCSCETINNKTEYWGNISQGETDRDCHQRWLHSAIRTNCRDCKFLPVCTPFDKCCIDYFDCKYKMGYIHNLYMQQKYNDYISKR